MTVPPATFPGQQPPPYPGAPVPPVPAKPKKPWFARWWVWVGAVVVVLIVASAIGGSKGSTTASPGTAANTSGSAATEPAKQPGVGTPVTVDDVTLTLKSFQTTNELSSALGNKKGHWMAVKVSVANGSKDAITIDNSSFTLAEADGTTYETDSDALMYVDSKESLFLKKINPKTQASGELLFAVPKKVGALTLTFKPSLFSSGASVPLAK